MIPANVDNIICGISRDESPDKLSEMASDDVDVSIIQELKTFLFNQINKFSPDRIIVVERKGTAILRSLKELDFLPINWPWEKVISSAVIDWTPDEFFEGHRILIFDDMLRTGLHIWDELFNKLKSRIFWNSIEDKTYIASFAIHTQFQKECGRMPDAWFYNNLSSEGYDHLRSRIVTMLQHAGSLMLDTEHIEVRVQVKCDVRSFFEALARKAKVINFHSSGERLNATIYYPDDSYSLPSEYFPEGTKTDSIVKKCRVIRRKGNEFALIPLCYPSIPSSLDIVWPSKEKFKEILGTPTIVSPESRFYDVALLSGIEVLKWTLTDLCTLSPDKYRLELPMPSENNSPGKDIGYTISHIKVMYPSVNVQKLTQYIHMKAVEAGETAAKFRRKKLTYQNIEPYTDEQLKSWAINLCGLIRNEIDDKIAIHFLEGMTQKPHPCGMTAEQIFKLGRSLGLQDHIISVLFDILIDNAYLVTHVQILPDEEGIMRAVRTFEPDGEVISERIRKYSLMWGLQNEFRS